MRIPTDYESQSVKTVEKIIDEKIVVLRELYIATEHNEKEIRYLLSSMIRKYPMSDPELVADHVAKDLIAKGGL